MKSEKELPSETNGDLFAQFQIVANALNNMKDGTDKTAAAYKLFGGRNIELLTAIEKAIAGFAPEVVYLNHRNDPHQDHKAVYEAAHISLRTISRHLPNRLQRIACYEVPSSTDQAPPFTEYAFLPNYYVDITPYLEKKKQAMACYETESRPFPHARSAEGIAALAKVRGMASNLSAAEAFVIVREEWP